MKWFVILLLPAAVSAHEKKEYEIDEDGWEIVSERIQKKHYNQSIHLI